jgi:hypothetical protein
MTQLRPGLRVESDPTNKISLIRVEGRLTDESLAELYEANRRYSTATHARVSIVDLSSVREFAVSSGFIRHLARQRADANHVCFIVVPEGFAFGLCRMFQLLGEATRPLLQIVHTLRGAFAAIGIQSPHFEPAIAPATLGAEYPAPIVAPDFPEVVRLSEP